MRLGKRATIATMHDATLAMSFARCRIALGAAAVLTPGPATRVIGGRRASEGITPLFARMLGARDIALGLGTVIALDRGKPVRGWLEGSALSDSVDCVACVLARQHMPPTVFRSAAGLAAASAVAGCSSRGALTRRHRLTPDSRRPLPQATHPNPSPAITALWVTAKLSGWRALAQIAPVSCRLTPPDSPPPRCARS